MRPTRLREELLDLALGYPEAYEDHPWGETVVKVGRKVFVFLGVDGGESYGMTVKLPESAPVALESDEVESAGYGLGRAGWCSVRFTTRTDPVLMREWLDESYRAVALKRHLRLLDDPHLPR